MRRKDGFVMPRSKRLLLILRNTLKRLEQDLGPDDPAFLRLKRSILQEVAILELEKPNEDTAQAA